MLAWTPRLDDPRRAGRALPGLLELRETPRDKQGRGSDLRDGAVIPVAVGTPQEATVAVAVASSRARSTITLAPVGRGSEAQGDSSGGSLSA